MKQAILNRFLFATGCLLLGPVLLLLLHVFLFCLECVVGALPVNPNPSTNDIRLSRLPLFYNSLIFYPIMFAPAFYVGAFTDLMKSKALVACLWIGVVCFCSWGIVSAVDWHTCLASCYCDQTRFVK